MTRFDPEQSCVAPRRLASPASHRPAPPQRRACCQAEIHASFILEKPFSLLALHTRRLEYDIFEEIGVPNAKVSIISMHPTTSIKCTYVAFGVLPEPRNASISPPALSLLRSSLIELVLQQINLTLTPSIYGEMMSFEDNMKKLKDQLKVGLNLRLDEIVYVQMTNVNGSTIAPPVTQQASILSDNGSGTLLPNRLKQLAETITGSFAQNLGLNHSVFGVVKSIVLTSYLNNSISSLQVSSPSPSPSPSPPIATPYSSPFKECSYHTGSLSPCSAPIDQNDLHPPCLFCENLSRTLSHDFDYRIGSQPGYSSNSAATNQSPQKGSKSPKLLKQSAHPVFFYSTSPVQDKESINASSTLHGSIVRDDIEIVQDDQCIETTDFSGMGSSRPILDRPGTIRYDKNPESKIEIISLRNRPGRFDFVLIGQDDVAIGRAD
ncbi:hypothetical protein MA16_Dca015497 [Dendrobium catenatum]|uniref:DUF7036 domain-containing protein n=1 Tax=Dendrobium catenatum TaxID=906689 RepID=A0A2I0X9P0_9ASPA|nr:hypothetical protein MA16_Dca015497 [Dendrobium catenatum]